MPACLPGWQTSPCRGRFSAPLNTNSSVPAIQSTTFALTSIGNETLSLQTLTIGIRKDRVRVGNLGVQVFALEGLSLFYLNRPEAWRLVADSELILDPYSDTGLIPLADFKSLEMTADQRWNLYISMDEDILDFSYQADARNGRLAFADDVMEVYTGAAFDDEAFMGSAIGGFSPNFAGTVHYRRSDCDGSDLSLPSPTSNITTTSVEYDYVLERTPSDMSIDLLLLAEEVNLLMRSQISLSQQDSVALNETSSVETFDVQGKLTDEPTAAVN